MAFIPHKARPQSTLIGKKYRLLEELENMTGVFEEGTEMTCVRISGHILHDRGTALTLDDGYGNQLLINTKSLKECAVEI